MLIKPCTEYLGFDDRKWMLVGIPALSLIMPIMLDIASESWRNYWVRMVPESFFYVTGFWAFYRTMIIALRKKFPSFDQTQKRLIIEGIAILVSAPILKAVLGSIIFLILAWYNIVDHNLPGYVSTMLSIYLPSALIVSVYEARYFFAQYKEALVAREEIEKQHIQTQLEHLRNQINPHFLFNSLNTLMGLIPVDKEAAMSYLSKLSKFYRFSVSQTAEKLIPLTKEIECAELFSDLLEERFRDGLVISFQIEEPGSYKILPMTLQLLIENAVKHNIVSESQPLKIKVTMDKKMQCICLRNNVQKKIQSVESTGMGLGNIRRRYAYFTSKPVEIREENSTFTVCLPLIK